MLRIKVTPEEYDTADIGDEWWQRIPDEGDTSVFLVTAVLSKKIIDNEFCLITGAFSNGPKFLHGDSGLRDHSQKEMAKEAGTE